MSSDIRSANDVRFSLESAGSFARAAYRINRVGYGAMQLAGDKVSAHPATVTKRYQCYAPPSDPFVRSLHPLIKRRQTIRRWSWRGARPAREDRRCLVAGIRTPPPQLRLPA
ncbi:MAG: hypothetical protein JWM55_675 [Acidimicrobiaceae bacterium]|nr:hypothetical protein [Acidimicrobiaceae bacterium]